MADEEKEEAGSGEDSTFDALERDFQEVLGELMGDKSLEKFRVEYEKLHQALKKSHESEKKLMHKCRELNAEIVSNSAKVTTALKLSQEDKGTINSLKQEIEKLWKMVDAAHEKEARARDTINQLKLEISNLTKLVEQGAGLSVGQESLVQDLTREKDELVKERDGHLKQIVNMRQRFSEANDRIRKAESERETAESAVISLRDSITVKEQEIDKELRRKSKLEKDLRQCQAELKGRGEEVEAKQNELQRCEEEIKKYEQQLRDTKTVQDRTLGDNNLLKQRIEQLDIKNKEQLDLSVELAERSTQMERELMKRADEVRRLKQEVTIGNKVRDGLQKKLQMAEEQKADLESNKESLKQQIGSLERELESQRKQAELDKRAYEDLVRERDALNKGLKKSEGNTERIENVLKIKEQTMKRLQMQIHTLQEEIRKQNQQIKRIEIEKETYNKETRDTKHRCIEQMEEMKGKEMELYQLKKKSAEYESKLKQQNALYEAVCGERNMFSKSLIEARDEITEMKRKLKIMSHQIDQLKEEIASKERALVKSNADLTHLEHEKESMSAEISSRRQELDQSRKLLDHQRAEESKLRRIISEASAERARQKRELEQVINERDILGTQVIRRNDELALLYEKIKIQQSTLNIGEVQYNQRLEDIRILKLEVRRMRRERATLSKSVSNMEDLRRELYHVQRELLRERTRCKALEEELENPMNIHRWRKLEGSDPSTYEMVQKIHTLQRKLIQKTEEVVEKELLIQEKEKLYIELKAILQRQPGPEVAEQLQIYQQTLKEKTKQMKSMASELNMYESQVSEYRMDIDRLQKEMQEIKKKYFLQKKKEMRMTTKDAGLTLPVIPTKRTELPSFKGGGFNFKHTQKAMA